MKPTQYQEPAPHPVPKEAEAYLKSLSPERKELHELAVKLLGSSYFIERTIGFKAWKDTSQKK
jgi:hypothetical protein